jgi:hypothetical protein
MTTIDNIMAGIRPDTHCWDDDTEKDVWSYSEELVRAAIEAVLTPSEPVAWWNGEHSSAVFAFKRDTPGIGLRNPDAVPLYAKPQPQREWVGLTDEEIIDVLHPLVLLDLADEQTDYEIARAIEARLREKNGGGV